MTVNQTVIQAIAAAVAARENCIKSGNAEWQDKWEDRLHSLQKQLPSGSGIDSGTRIDIDASSGRKIVLLASFHHMNDVGMYDGWTEHKVIVTPAFDGVDIVITGRNRNEIKDYLVETFDHALSLFAAV